ncbi:MAG: hypothetical protein F6K19_06640 [Cyanothece sp. SIO1E1]|nr:hypothetical protein [Cyanothece sp. SIO1E1]
MEKRSKSKLTQWLEVLQQESWQLELLVSGFAIFLLIGTYEPLLDLGRKARLLASESSTYAALLIPYGILMAVWFALVFNLIIHVLFRGLWISTIGLRYVSDDIDFDYFGFSPPFDKFLRRRIPSFDAYIERLEKICSIIFAFTFLIIFIILSLGFFMSVTAVFNIVLDYFGVGSGTVSNIINLIIFVTCFLYFLDFLTLGNLKRVKWFSKFYYPIYRFYGFVTLAFLYRSMYYNLIDNKFGRWVGALIVPYIVLAMILASINFVTHTYYPSRPGKTLLSTVKYDDTRSETARTNAASIPSKYLDNGYLEVFLPYNPGSDDKSIESLCPGLTPAKNTGVKIQGIVNFNNINNRNSDVDSLLMCMSSMHRLYVNDSLFSDPTFHFYNHPTRDNVGLITILDVNYLERGKHQFHMETYLQSRVDRRDTMLYVESAVIPFWKE